jgi:hypothetical protein
MSEQPPLPDWNAMSTIDALSNGHIFAMKLLQGMDSDGKATHARADSAIATLHETLQALAEMSDNENVKDEVHNLLDPVTDSVMDAWYDGLAMGIRLEALRQSIGRELMVKCPTCQGSGKLDRHDCRVCGATGTVRFWSFT